MINVNKFADFVHNGLSHFTVFYGFLLFFYNVCCQFTSESQFFGGVFFFFFFLVFCLGKKRPVALYLQKSMYFAEFKFLFCIVLPWQAHLLLGKLFVCFFSFFYKLFEKIVCVGALSHFTSFAML